MKLYIFVFSAVLLTLVTLYPNFASCQIVSTFAGTGSPGHSGDGGPANAAGIWWPVHTARDAAGNIYFTDYSNSCIRKVDHSGTITTYAGTGSMGYSGDGGAATLAQINCPTGIAVDNMGNVIFADWLNQRVRKIDTNGIITTIAGTGVWGYNGDGIQATSAQISKPWGIETDNAGNIYFADRYNSRIRKISPSGIISTIAGTGTMGWAGDGGPATAALISDPVDIVFDQSGNMFFSDFTNNRIREVTVSGTMKAVAGNGLGGYSGDGGPATAASLNNPVGLAVEKEVSVIYVADYNNSVIRKIDAGDTISTIIGTGSAGFNGDGLSPAATQINAPQGVSIYDGVIYFCDVYNNRVRYIHPVTSSQPTTIDKAEELEIFPNPNKGTFYVAIPSVINSRSELVIYSTEGRKMTSIWIEPTTRIATVHCDLAAGIYSLMLSSGKEKFMGKITITD